MNVNARLRPLYGFRPDSKGQLHQKLPLHCQSYSLQQVMLMQQSMQGNSSPKQHRLLCRHLSCNCLLLSKMMILWSLQKVYKVSLLVRSSACQHILFIFHGLYLLLGWHYIRMLNAKPTSKPTSLCPTKVAALLSTLAGSLLCHGSMLWL